jgi:phage-related protein
MAAQVFPTTSPPHAGSSKDTQMRILKSKMGDGYTQAGSDGLNPQLDTHALTWDTEKVAVVDEMITFLEAHLGYIPFLFTPPGETQALFTAEQWSVNWVGSNAKTLTVSFERWFGGAP